MCLCVCLPAWLYSVNPLAEGSFFINQWYTSENNEEAEGGGN